MGMLDLDALLDSDLKDVEAAPNYVTPENGIYKLVVKDAKAEEKKSTKPEAGKPDTYAVVILQYEIAIVHEQQEGTMPVAPGSLFSDQFQFSEKGLPYLKTRLADILTANGEDGVDVVNTTKMSALLIGIKGMEFECQIKKVAQKKDGVVVEGQYNTRIESITAPRAE